jgi:hypothetical protein
VTGAPGPSRRAVVHGGLVTGLAALAGCTPGSPAPPGRDRPEPTAVPGGTVPRGGTAPPVEPGAVAVPPPVDVPAYEVLAGEVEPACKVVAVRALEAVLTWRDGRGAEAASRERLAAAGGRPDAVAPMAALLGAAPWSSLRVVYPQYGGLLPDRSAASVMTVAEQLRAGNGEVLSRPLVVDVRLARPGDAWVVTDLLLADPPEPAAEVSDAARALLASDGVSMPAAARADVEAGVVDDLVAGLLVSLGERWRVVVQVLRSGHPVNVFGTDRVSNHTRGRAVDLWAIDGVPVVDRDRSAWRAVMEAAAAYGATEIGGPQDLDGGTGQRPFFSDALHQDHLHLGFEV